jgi:hypothetical protein
VALAATVADVAAAACAGVELSVHADAFAPLVKCSGHTSHAVEPGAAAKVPSGQPVQLGDDDAFEKNPGPHGRHAVVALPTAPVLLLYDPAGHARHSTAPPAASVYVPGSHAGHDDAPVTLLAVPAGHATHASAVDAFGCGLKEPAAHGEQTAEPEGA